MCQMRMHCNLRSPNAMPVLFRFNYDNMPSLKWQNLCIVIL